MIAIFDRQYREPAELPEEKEDALERWERMMSKPEPPPRLYRPHPQGRETCRLASGAGKFELVDNTETARILGLTVPPSLLAIADEVIE